MYSIKANKNDSLLLKHIVFSNDLGYYPNEISVELNDSVRVKEK